MSFWSGKRVLVTGHTGFKGAWLTHWLLRLGAEVQGVALEPETSPALFHQIGLAGRMASTICDLRDPSGLDVVVRQARPDVVIHLAAQALVRRSYRDPLETWTTNVIGTANLLAAIGRGDRSCTVLVATTDKVYGDRDRIVAHRETDRLGGADPYSASKAATELLLDSWRKSFFAGSPVRLAVARAGNVVGGGDWAEDRIVPDIVRALSADSPVVVRNPDAVRPWQHVLEPLGGYLCLIERATTSDDPVWQSAFNFGPKETDGRSVAELVSEVLRHWPGRWEATLQSAAPRETRYLSLSIDKACGLLGWRPRWDFERTIAETVNWYRATRDGADPRALMDLQIDAYETAA